MPHRPSSRGAIFSRLGKLIGRHICGKPMCLYYDGEYRDGNADFEPCFPVRKQVTVEGVSIRPLPRARCLTLILRGAHDQLGHSYAKILQESNERQAKVSLPTREVYVKGPGMIFKGNPRNYLTEIQLPV
jgi:effector-binding domain-containing protein